MELSKEEIARLRHLDPAGVHAALIASGDLDVNNPLPRRAGDLRPAENAIDAVKYAKKCDYSEAVAWLHEHFAEDKAHERNVGIRTTERELFGSEIVINKLVRQQMDALGCSEARITLMFKESDETNQKGAQVEIIPESDLASGAADTNESPIKRKGKFGYLIGKRVENGEKTEKFFNTRDIQNCVGMLRHRNGEGMNVLMTPMDRHCFYILVDDARNRDGTESESPVQSWIAAGYKPCLALRTSWESHQIIFRVPKEPFRIISKTGNDDSCFDRSGLHAYFQKLNQEHGDPRISGLRHGIRLAGYRNMKPKHERIVEGKDWSIEYPFVAIEHAESTFCVKTQNDALRMCREDVVGRANLNVALQNEARKHVAALRNGEAARTAQKLTPRYAPPLKPQTALGRAAAGFDRRDSEKPERDREQSICR